MKSKGVIMSCRWKNAKFHVIEFVKETGSIYITYRNGIKIGTNSQARKIFISRNKLKCFKFHEINLEVSTGHKCI